MKAQRPALRQWYIDQGLIPDPRKAQKLEDAIDLVGTCEDMCPEYEREEREFQGAGDLVWECLSHFKDVWCLFQLAC